MNHKFILTLAIGISTGFSFAYILLISSEYSQRNGWFGWVAVYLNFATYNCSFRFIPPNIIIFVFHFLPVKVTYATSTTPGSRRTPTSTRIKWSRPSSLVRTCTTRHSTSSRTPQWRRPWRARCACSVGSWRGPPITTRRPSTLRRPGAPAAIFCFLWARWPVNKSFHNVCYEFC